MQYSPNAVKAGAGMFAAFGVGIGLLMYIMVNESSDLFGDDFEDIGVFIAIMGLVIAVLFSPILAVIVGAIIAKDFDDEGDAAFNGALAGAGGSILMVIIAVFITNLAMADVIADSNLSDDEANIIVNDINKNVKLNDSAYSFIMKNTEAHRGTIVFKRNNGDRSIKVYFQ